MHHKHNILRYVQSDPKAQKEVARLRIYMTDLHKTGKLAESTPGSVMTRALELVKAVIQTYRLEFRGARQAAASLVERLRSEIIP